MGTTDRAREFEYFLSTALREEDLIEAKPALQKLDIPTLIVWATNDIFFGIEWAHWLAHLIPSANAPITIDNAALYFPDERPEALIPYLKQHWSAQ